MLVFRRGGAPFPASRIVVKIVYCLTKVAIDLSIYHGESALTKQIAIDDST